MHSKMYIVKFDFEDIPEEDIARNIMLIIDNFEYNTNKIDYFQTIEQYASMGDYSSNWIELYNDILRDKIEYLVNELNAEKVSENKVRFTKAGLDKYYSKVIQKLLDKLIMYKTLNNGYDVERFISEYYKLTHEFDEDDPKWYSNYTYIEDDGDFIRSIYTYMSFNHLEEVEMKIIDIWDYHY